MKIKQYLLVILVICIFSSLLITKGIAQDSDTGIGTVRVSTNILDPFVDLDPIDVDKIAESDRTPYWGDTVELSVRIAFEDNTSGEITVTLSHDDGTDLVSFTNISMTYNAGRNLYLANLGPYSTDTFVNYFVDSYDGKNREKTPVTGYVNLTWVEKPLINQDPKDDILQNIVNNEAIIFFTIGTIVVTSGSLFFFFFVLGEEGKKQLRRRVDKIVSKRLER
jgi:hypothetical protein